MLLLMSVAAGLGYWRLGLALDTFDVEVAGAVQDERDVRALDMAFKEQVQEWKNVRCCAARTRNERLATAAGRDLEGPVQVAIGQQDLSLVCGLSRQRTNAALATLDALGLVRTEFKSLRVRSLTALRDFIG